jgi:hypothetical protein
MWPLLPAPPWKRSHRGPFGGCVDQNRCVMVLADCNLISTGECIVRVSGRFRLLSHALMWALVISFLVVLPSTRASAAPSATPGAGSVNSPLPATATKNHGLPAGKSAPPVPPAAEAGGKVRVPTATERASGAPHVRCGGGRPGHVRATTATRRATGAHRSGPLPLRDADRGHPADPRGDRRPFTPR